MHGFQVRRIAAVLLLVAVAGMVSAQEAGTAAEPQRRWEVYGGYGVFSIDSVGVMVLSALVSPFFALADKEEDLNYTDSGVFNLGVDYYCTEHLYAGATACYQNFHALDTNLSFFTFMLEGGVQYGWSRFQFYHALAGGVTVANLDYIQPFFGFHVTALGIKVRPADRLWLYADAGFGQKGMVNAGLRYRL